MGDKQRGQMAAVKVQKRLFGTNGVRGVAGESMHPALAFSIGQALGRMRRGRLAVGMDTRTSGTSLLLAVKSGIMASGSDVVDCGILPTPALQYLIKEKFDGGAMITASHNPPEYNGVKIIEADGTEMGDDETAQLEKFVLDTPGSTVSWENIGKEIAAPYLYEEYIQAIVNHFPGKPGSGITVAVDPGSGPASLTTAKILTGMGCRVLTVNGIPDGTFPGRMPEPTPEGLRKLSDLVTSSGAAFGVAHDGDADRAVFVDENGNFIEENAEFALIAESICKKERGTIVTPVSTSGIVDIVACRHGSSVCHTPVGSIYVARTMLSLIDEGENVILGGEGNGGIIFPRHQFCRDGGMTAAYMVHLTASGKRPLSDLVRSLPRRHMIKDKIPIKDAHRILDHLAKTCPCDRIDMTDGLKIFFDKDCWALIRSSGTEPILRILVDAEHEETGRKYYDDVMKRIGSPDR
jgi:phosphomannomutase/phosphoglucomutase